MDLIIQSGYLERLRHHRRALHRIPEIGDEEQKTSSYIKTQLEALQPDDLRSFAGTGIRAVFKGDGTGRVLAFRADMDALPIREETGCPYASEHPGLMHACGHDGHMANLLTFAEWTAANRSFIRDTVVLIFQPAEETVGGAKRMVDEGVLEGVDAIYGIHLMPDIPKGKIASCSGPIMAQTSEIDLTLRGKAAHAAMPHLGCDAVSAMGHLITLLQTITARCIDPRQAALITIGRVEAGKQRNVLADYAKLEGVVRTFSNEVYQLLESRILAGLQGIESAFGVKAEFKRNAYFPCVNNDQEEFERVRRLLADRFVLAQPKMTAEDFSYYQLYVPGVYVFCGCMDESHDSPLHTPTFDFDESALIPALELFIKLVNYRS